MISPCHQTSLPVAKCDLSGSASFHIFGHKSCSQLQSSFPSSASRWCDDSAFFGAVRPRLLTWTVEGKTWRKNRDINNIVSRLQVREETTNKKRVLVQNKSNSLLKIILYNTWTLQLFTINIINCNGKYTQKIISHKKSLKGSRKYCQPLISCWTFKWKQKISSALWKLRLMNNFIK